MKIRDVKDLPTVKLGQTDLEGKVLVSPDDGVPFAVYEIHLDAGKSIRFTAFRMGENHIYYCITGKCTVQDEGIEMQLATDHMLALTAEAQVAVKVLEPTRVVIVSLPRDPNMSPPKHCLKNLDEIINSELNVNWGNGYSRRFLTAKDGFNVSLHNTLAAPNQTNPLQYLHHVEANYVIEGEGTKYEWEDGKRSYAFVPDGGTMFLLDEHDSHNVCTGDEELKAICVFFPALQGHETHKTSKSGGPSSY